MICILRFVPGRFYTSALLNWSARSASPGRVTVRGKLIAWASGARGIGVVNPGVRFNKAEDTGPFMPAHNPRANAPICRPSTTIPGILNQKIRHCTCLEWHSWEKDKRNSHMFLLLKEVK